MLRWWQNGTAGPGPSPDPLSPLYNTYLESGYSTALCGGLPCYTADATILNSAMWNSIAAFGQATGTEILWDLNAVDFRTPSPNRVNFGQVEQAGAWDPQANATALFAYTAANKLKIAGWELGNEPDLWPLHYGLNVSGAQLAMDLRNLQAGRPGG